MTGLGFRGTLYSLLRRTLPAAVLDGDGGLPFQPDPLNVDAVARNYEIVEHSILAQVGLQDAQPRSLESEVTYHTLGGQVSHGENSKHEVL